MRERIVLKTVEPSELEFGDVFFRSGGRWAKTRSDYLSLLTSVLYIEDTDATDWRSIAAQCVELLRDLDPSDVLAGKTVAAVERYDAAVAKKPDHG